MGKRNVLIEGISGTGKTSVCHELNRRGYQAYNGDTQLVSPPTSDPASAWEAHSNHIWDVARVEAIVSDHGEAVTFLCGGSRNFHVFEHHFDAIFVLEVDLDTLNRRLDGRSAVDWGAKPEERELIVALHQTRADVPKNGIIIDTSAPLTDVVDDILRHLGLTQE